MCEVMVKGKKKKTVIVVPPVKAKAPRNPEHRMWGVYDLRPHPRQSEFFSGMTELQLKELAKAIQRDGLEQPLEILSDGTVISGHQRLKAVRLLDWPEVPVIVRSDL